MPKPTIDDGGTPGISSSNDGTSGITDDPNAVSDGKDDNDVKFTDIDPSTLSDDLKPIYNSMLKDYREKTTEIADERKSSTEKIAQLEENNRQFVKANEDWANQYHTKFEPHLDDFEAMVKNKVDGTVNDNDSTLTTDGQNPIQDSQGQNINNNDLLDLGTGFFGPQPSDADNDSDSNKQAQAKEEKMTNERLDKVEAEVAAQVANFTKTLTTNNQALALLINSVKNGDEIDLSKVAELAQLKGIDLVTAKSLLDGANLQNNVTEGDLISKDKVETLVADAVKTALEKAAKETNEANINNPLGGPASLPQTIIKRLEEGAEVATTFAGAKEKTIRDLAGRMPVNQV